MQLNATQRELVLKIVYYGPGLSGKTTNLQALHARLDPSRRGRLMTLDTADDRTLFFDVMPVFFQSTSGLKVKVKLYTVPGQVMHDSTRRLVLQGVDGVAFIADSQRSQSRANSEYWANLLLNLKENGLDYDELPIVVQFNKRDLPDIRSEEELAELQTRQREPIYQAVAIRGEGVVETFRGLLSLTWDNLERKHELRRKFGISREEFLSGLLQHLEPEPAPAEEGG